MGKSNSKNRDVEVVHIANFIIEYCRNRRIELNPLKIQKLSYYIYVATIIKEDSPIKIIQCPQKWKTGASFQELHWDFSGRYNLVKPITLVKRTYRSFYIEEYTNSTFSKKEKKFIESVLTEDGLVLMGADELAKKLGKRVFGLFMRMIL